MKALLRSPVLAASILAIGLVTSAFIVTRPTSMPAGQYSKSLLNGKIKSQFVSQVEMQLGGNFYDVMGTKRQLQNIMIDKFQMSPNGNRVDIDYHAAWQGTDVATYTDMTLTKDEYGRFTSGQVYGMLGDKPLEVIAQ